MMPEWMRGAVADAVMEGDTELARYFAAWWARDRDALLTPAEVRAGLDAWLTH